MNMSVTPEFPKLPTDWWYCLVGKPGAKGNDIKAPFEHEWQTKNIGDAQIKRLFESGKSTGYGIIWGRSGYLSESSLIGLDIDGPVAHAHLLKLADGREIPKTISWTSGTPGKYQLSFALDMDQQLRLADATKGFKGNSKGRFYIEFEGENGTEQFDFRWHGHQSVLPPSLHDSGRRYRWVEGRSPEELNYQSARMPDWLFDALLQIIEDKKRPQPKPEPPKPVQQLTLSTSSNCPPIPLEKVLTREHRDWIENGVGEGGRNDSGAALARDLIGAATYLELIGQQYDGDPRQLFDQFCARCNPPIGEDDSSEPDKIWQSAERDNPGPSLTSEAIENCIKAWERRQQVLNSPTIHPSAVIKETQEGEGLLYKGVRLNPLDAVIDVSIDLHVYNRLFEGGSGNWVVISQKFCRYTGKGYWEVMEDELIDTKIAEICRDAYKVKSVKTESGYIEIPQWTFATNRNVESAFKYCRKLLAVTTTNREGDSLNQHLRVFSNCTLDLTTGETLPHSKAHYLTSCIDAPYIPGADCPADFARFIATAYAPDVLPMVRALTYMLLDPTAPYEKLIHLKGPSGGGKGTLLRFWTSMFGTSQTRSISNMALLSTPEGVHQYLNGVQLITIPDTGGRQLNVRGLYELTDNGMMAARPLHSSTSYNKKYNVRFIVGSVEDLTFDNAADGWARRAIQLTVNHRTGPADLTLGQRLQACKAQVISWALGMDKKYRDELLNCPDQIESIGRASRESTLSGDSVRTFLNMVVRHTESDSPDDCLTSTQLWGYYSEFCKTFGYIPKNVQNFVSHMKTVLPWFYADRRRATAAEKKAGASQNIAAYWKHLEIIPTTFSKGSDSGSLTCLRDNCRDGQLEAILEFAEQKFFPRTLPTTETHSPSTLQSDSEGSEGSEPRNSRSNSPESVDGQGFGVIDSEGSELNPLSTLYREERGSNCAKEGQAKDFSESLDSPESSDPSESFKRSKKEILGNKGFQASKSIQEVEMLSGESVPVSDGGSDHKSLIDEIDWED